MDLPIVGFQKILYTMDPSVTENIIRLIFRAHILMRTYISEI